MRLLDRYILKSFLLTWLMAFVCMVGLWIVADLMLNIDEFTKGEPGGGQLASRIFRYYGYHLLEYFRYLSALITVVAAGFTLARLQRNNEMAPMLAGGTSAYRVILPILLGGLGFLLLHVVVQEVWIPACRGQLSRDREFDGVDPSFSVRLLKEGAYRIESQQVHPHREALTAAEVIDLLYGPRQDGPEPVDGVTTTSLPVKPTPEILRPQVHVVLPREYRGRRVRIEPHHTYEDVYMLYFVVGKLGSPEYRRAMLRIDVSQPRPLTEREREDFRNVVVVAKMPRRRPVAINLLDDSGRFGMLPVMDQPRLIVRDEAGRFLRFYSADAGVWWPGAGPDDPDRRWHWDHLSLGEDPALAAAAPSRPASSAAADGDAPLFAPQVNLPVPLTLPPDELELRSNHEWLNLLSLWELARRAESEDYRDAQIYVILHFRFSTWFFSVILLLLGLPLLMNVERTNLFTSGLYATLMTVGPYVFHFVLQQMAGNWPVGGVVVAAWLPIFVFGGLVGALLQSVRT